MMTETTEERRITVRPSMALAARNRPRGMWGQITTALLRPALFYKTLPPAGETRQWLWAALLVLALVGIAAVRYSTLSSTSSDGGGMIDVGAPPVDDFGGGFDGGLGGGFGGGGPDFGGVPPTDGPVDGGGGVPAESTLTADLTMALLASANVVLGWFVLTVMLVVVPMLRGRAPRVGQNLQIAVWSSLPLAVLAVVQLLYWSGGGKLGEPGVQGLLAYWPDFDTLDANAQAALISFTSRLTIFWLWSLMLVYFGARFALGGWRIVAFLVVIAWAVLQVGAPVLTGAIVGPAAVDMGGETPVDGGGEMPTDMGGEMPVDGGGEVPTDMGGEMPTDDASVDTEDEVPADTEDGSAAPGTDDEGVAPETPARP